MSETTNETTQEEEAAQEASGTQDVSGTQEMSENEENAVEEQTGDEGAATESSGFLFPHEAPAEHWNVDFGDSKQTYEGSALPVWILAGWAIFILWAVVYLIFGLPTAF